MCEITLVNNQNIFYNHKTKKTELNEFIGLFDIESYSKGGELKVLNADNIPESINYDGVQDTLNHRTPWATWLQLTNGNKHKGTLMELNDSSLHISNSTQDIPRDAPIITEYAIKDIYNIKVRHEISPILSGVIGLGVGAATGWVYGYYYLGESHGKYISFSRGLNGLIFGLLGAPIGLAIGVPIGFLKTNIPILGKLNNYNKAKKKLMKYSAIKNHD